MGAPPGKPPPGGGGGATRPPPDSCARKLSACCCADIAACVPLLLSAASRTGVALPTHMGCDQPGGLSPPAAPPLISERLLKRAAKQRWFVCLEQPTRPDRHPLAHSPALAAAHPEKGGAAWHPAADVSQPPLRTHPPTSRQAADQCPPDLGGSMTSSCVQRSAPDVHLIPCPSWSPCFPFALSLSDFRRRPFFSRRRRSSSSIRPATPWSRTASPRSMAWARTHR